MSGPFFELRCAGLATAEGSRILDGVSWAIPGGAVTVVLGPSGTGKTLLLQALAGMLPPGVSPTGGWTHRGSPLGHGRSTSGTLLVPQVRPPRPSELAAERPPRWGAAFESGAETLLLEEATVDANPDQVADLSRLLRRHRDRGTVVVVTHDLGFARSVADEVALFVAGRLEASGPSPAFFETPSTPLAGRFVRDGNCWPAAPQLPELPASFGWVLPGQLAGMPRPGLLRDLETDLSAIAGAGVSEIVTLTAEALPAAALRASGLRGRHFPITDMGVPAVGPAARLCRDIHRTMTGGDAVAVHCHAGLGRTGTILASVLVWMGRPPLQAIDEVRRVNPRYIQNDAQAGFVVRFAETCGAPQPAAG